MSNEDEFGATAAVGSCDDDQDPLGILRGASSFQHRALKHAGPRHVESPEQFFRDGGYCGENGDPREIIDAILRRSRAIRDRVSSRQVLVLDAYKAESQQLHKELSLLPPTYNQYRAVREKANSRRRQRTTAAVGAATSTAISHPLNFHLRDRYSQPTQREPKTEKSDNERPLEDDERETNEGCRAAQRGAGVGHGGKGDVSDGGRLPLEEGGCNHAVGKEPIDDHRRCSTLARAGSASENLVPKSSAPCHFERAKIPTEGGVPALRRSKVRGRQMVFSLLEAARIEEEEMEEILACPVSDTEEGGRRRREAAFHSLNEARKRNARELDTLMAEYDPRPSRCRREHTLDKLRRALPWPESAPRVATGRAMGGGGGGTRDGACLRGEIDFDVAGEAEEKRGGGRLGSDSNEEGFSAEHLSNGNRQASPEGRRTEKGDELSPRTGGEDDGAGADADGPGLGGGPASTYRVSDSSHGSSDRGLSSTHGDTSDRGVETETDGVTGTGNGIVAPDDGGDENEVHPGLPPTLGASPFGDDTDKHDGNPSVLSVNGDRAHGGATSKRPATGQRKKPTLPDPNEVNGSVMADPFNMDHIKDLPGLIGGDCRELSRLVSDTVSYIDPAFPNLEFHRRAAMNTAGYFMPGYKPQVNSPGPDAGAYWLERRQSYRVKMAAPPASRSNNTANKHSGNRSRTDQQHQQQRRQRQRHRRPPQRNTNATADSVPVTFEANGGTDTRSRPQANDVNTAGAAGATDQQQHRR